jgi:hypothetical protein
MNQIIARLSVLAFLLILATPPVIADTTGANEFEILYSNNVNGETEPCG